MTKRLYFGRLPQEARSEDLSKFLDGYGRITDCRVMTGFGFVEFETDKDAEEVVHVFNGKNFMGAAIVVEFAKENRTRREPFEDRGGYGGGGGRGAPPRARRPPGFRVIVSGISRDTSWQDLKDFGREGANAVTFADIDRDNPGQGILEYSTREDAEHASRTLDGRDLRGNSVRVAVTEERGTGGGGGGGGGDRRDDRYREDRYREDRPPRRDRSRSPARRDYDRERRPRSPRRDRSPPREFERREYEDRRHDDRRAPADYDRRRERDERRDDRGRANGGADPAWTERRP